MRIIVRPPERAVSASSTLKPWVGVQPLGCSGQAKGWTPTLIFSVAGALLVRHCESRPSPKSASESLRPHPANAPFFRPEGAPTNQPRATPWVSSPLVRQALKGRHIGRPPALFRPFRAKTDTTNLKPGAALPLVALPQAGLWWPLRGGRGNRGDDSCRVMLPFRSGDERLAAHIPIIRRCHSNPFDESAYRTNAIQ